MPLTRLYCEKCEVPPTELFKFVIGSCSCIPEPLQALVIQDEAENYHNSLPENTFTATMLTGCLRKTFLKKTVEYDSTPKARYPAIRGRIIHGILEGYHEPWVKEERYEKSVGNGITLTGQIDAENPEESEIVDYKTMADDGFTFLKEGPKTDHCLQVNIYRWLRNGGRNLRTRVISKMIAKKLTIWYVGMRNAAKTGSWVNVKNGWKVGRYFLKPVEIMDYKDVETFIRRATKTLKEAFTGGVMPPMTTEKWMCKVCEVKKQCDEFNERGKA